MSTIETEPTQERADAFRLMAMTSALTGAERMNSAELIASSTTPMSQVDRCRRTARLGTLMTRGGRSNL